jgi:hypothetical protein
VRTIFHRDLFQTSAGWVSAFLLLGENLCIAVTTFWGIFLQVSSAISTKFVVSLTSVVTFQPHQNERKLKKSLVGIIFKRVQFQTHVEWVYVF